MKLRVLKNFTATLNGNRFPLQAGQELKAPVWFETLAEYWIQAGLAERVATDEGDTDGKEVSGNSGERP